MTENPPILRTLFQPVGQYCKDLGRGTITGWNRFWFTPRDPTGVAVIRVVVGLVLLWAHGTTCMYVLDYIGPDAWLSTNAIEQLRDYYRDSSFPGYTGERKPTNDWAGSWSIWHHIQDPTWIWVTYGIFLVAIVCFILGLFTRFAAVLVWAGQLSYIQRGWTIFYGLDTMLAVALLYLMIAPSGATLSLDRLIARYRAVRRGARAGGSLIEPALQPSILANIATRCFQVHLCIIYLCAGLAKLQGGTWWSGYAIYIALMIPELNFHDMSWMVPFDPAYDWIWQLISSAGIFLTLAVEIGFPFLVWNATLRPVLVFLAMAMHAHIAVFMGLGTFQMVMIAMLFAYVSPATLRWVVAVIFRGPGGYRFVYDPSNPDQLRAAAWIRAADPYRQVELIEAIRESPPTLAGGLVLPDGRELQGYAAFRQVVRSLRGFWPVAWLTFIPGSAALGRALIGRGTINGLERHGAPGAAA